MYKIEDFIKWALTHASRNSIPSGAAIPVPTAQCGTEPWHYLFGTTKTLTTENKLEERWKNYYSTHGWTRTQYEAATKGWKATDYATDCQGLLDAWLTEQGEKTDINANMNYTNWCSGKGKVGSIDRPFVVGEALFMANSSGNMHHVGWICGTDMDGEPLVVEARGLSYGVVVTRLESRNWTHRGLMTTKFTYDNNVEEEKPMAQTIFEKTSPMKTGDAFRKMQAALNAAGYTDANGKKLSEDGKWGTNSHAAFDKLLAAHKTATDKPVEEAKPTESAVYLTSEDGKYELKLSITEVGK